MNHGHRSPGVVVRRFTPSPDGVGTKGTRVRATVNLSSAERGVRNAESETRGSRLKSFPQARYAGRDSAPLDYAQGQRQRRRDAEDEMNARWRGKHETRKSEEVKKLRSEGESG